MIKRKILYFLMFLLIPFASFCNTENGVAEILPFWTIIPFVALLGCIAAGPVLFPKFWHKKYPFVASGLGLLVVIYYIGVLHDVHHPIHALAEFIQFIALLAALFTAAGGIMIKVDKEGTPLTNVVLLLVGALLANLIGTTGASMLLIRPFIRLNKNRIKPYHIMFFIFIVSNVGGALTPIGDPPLFLGFLKGVPFSWTISHCFLPWFSASILLLVMFYFVDKKNFKSNREEYTGKLKIIGKKNFIFLFFVILCVFIDPNISEAIPYILYDGVKISFLREILLLALVYVSYRFASGEAHHGNEFDFDPIKEVSFLFIGIFATMMPALQLVSSFAVSPEGKELIDANFLYWSSGFLSSFLDNAPTYLNFMTASIAAHGGDVSQVAHVQNYALGLGDFKATTSGIELMAVSIASVFFGAMTYIGNGPNFMVKAIADSKGVKTPSFFTYIFKYSVPMLLPVLVIIWVIYFQLGLGEWIVNTLK